MSCYRILKFIRQLPLQIGTTQLRQPRILCSTFYNTFFKARSVNMSATLEQLEKERQELEAKVREMVDKLESKKDPSQAKVPKDAIFRSKEECEASAAMEKLELANSQQTDSCKLDKPAAAKKNNEGKKPKASGGTKDQTPAVDKPVDVSRLDLRIGKILEVDRHPDADALYVEKIDCGDPTGPRTVISGLVKHVPIEEMRNRFVVVLCNLKPAKMRGILSEAMVMCASTPEKVELLQPPENVKPGDRVVFANYPGEPDAQLNPKKKIWETVSPDIKTNGEGIAMYKESEFRVEGNEALDKSGDHEEAYKEFGILKDRVLKSVGDRLDDLKHQNAFKLFDLKEDFNIDLAKLQREMRNLQRILHPDKFIDSNTTAQNVSNHLSALVNENYAILSNPYERGKYLLSLMTNKSMANIESEMDGVKLEEEFLANMMDIRTNLDELVPGLDKEELSKISSQLESEMLQLSRRLSKHFEAKDEASIKRDLGKMKFIANCYSIARDRLGGFNDF